MAQLNTKVILGIPCALMGLTKPMPSEQIAGKMGAICRRLFALR